MSKLQNFFTFKLGNSWLAVEPDAVVTILDPQRYIPLPLAPQHILGIIPHGQSILPILNLALFLKMKEDGDDGEGKDRLLILKKGDLEVVVPIKITGGVEMLPEQGLLGSILTKNGRLQDFLSGEYEGLHGITGILDIGLILERSRV